MIAARLTIRHRHTTLAKVASELDGVAQESWLCAAELEVINSLRDPNRRAAWLAGRYVAKQLILATLAETESRQNCRVTEDLTSADLCILSRDACARGVHPLILLQGRLMPWTLSLSHNDETLGAVLALTEDVRLGIDFTNAADVTSRLAKAWFTNAEWDLVQQSTRAATRSTNHADFSCLIATIWSAKEAAYKALNEGESFAPKRIEVSPLANNRWLACWQVSRTRRECHVHTEWHAGTVKAMAAVGWTGITEAAKYPDS